MCLIRRKCSTQIYNSKRERKWRRTEREREREREGERERHSQGEREIETNRIVCMRRMKT